MPVFQLSSELIFPDPALARFDGLLAVGGDLSPERLLLAYRLGIFPWYGNDDPILWWSPNPRMVLFPAKLRVTKSMRQVMRNKHFELTIDQDFRAVITACKNHSRPGQQFGTWITDDMLEAYCQLHHMGFAHSVEVWKNGELAGGLYGLSLGRCFFGESMFAKVSNASKAGFITLAGILKEKGFELIDCQTETGHLKRMGAELIARECFLEILNESNQSGDMIGSWSDLIQKYRPEW